MKVVAKRRRSDSASAAVAAAQAAALGPLSPPQHIALRDDAKPYWIAIMQARARDTWTEIDLISAVALAHAQATVGRSADGAKALANERAAADEHDDLIPTLRAVK